MKDRNGEEHLYNVEIKGWVGTYKSTRGRKAEMADFLITSFHFMRTTKWENLTSYLL